MGSTEAGVPAGARRDSGSPSDGPSRVAAPGTGAIGRSALSGELTVPARAAQSTLANGFQESQGLGQQDWTTLSLLDDATRYAVALESTGSTRSEAVRECLESTFKACGLPDAMLMDHGCPWWNQQAFGGWTQLSVWLMRQSIRLYFSGVRHPQTQGKVERFHGALEMARRRRGLPEASLHQRWLDDFRQEYNHLRRHEALAMKTPASLWHPSARRYDPSPPAWQYAEGAEVRRLESTGQLLLHGRRWQVAGPLAGELVRLERLEQRVLVFYCNTLIRELNLTVEQEGKDGGPAALENALRFPLSLPAAAAVDQA